MSDLRGYLFSLGLGLVLASLTATALQAATPGLPFTEDFSSTDLRDDGLTDANWSTEEQSVFLAWSQSRQAAAL